MGPIGSGVLTVVYIIIYRIQVFKCYIFKDLNRPLFRHNFLNLTGHESSYEYYGPNIRAINLPMNIRARILGP